MFYRIFELCLFALSSQNILALFLRFSIFSWCQGFLFCVSSLISHPGFEFRHVFLRETWFFHRQFFFPENRVRLISLCCSLIFVFIIRKFFQFLTWLFSSLDCSEMIRTSFYKHNSLQNIYILFFFMCYYFYHSAWMSVDSITITWRLDWVGGF